MTNSPGPSSSQTPEPESNAKKKRTRRRTRKPKVSLSEELRGKCVVESDEQAEFLPNFVIEAVKEPAGKLYKRRSPALGHINLNSFINHTVPWVFITKSACDPGNVAVLLEKIKRFSCSNGVRAPAASPKRGEKGPCNHEEKKKKKEKKKKEPTLFPKYLTPEEVRVGLEKGELMKGFIRINPKNFKEAYVANKDVTKSDYIIGSILDRNRALEGDEVILRLQTVTEEKKKLMEVVYITQKVHPRTAVGYLEPIEKNKEYALFCPRDRRIPKIKIPKISWPSGFQNNPKLYENILFVAKIADWREVKHALGTLVENLGVNGDLKVESLAILREMCLDPSPFGADVKQFLPKSPEIPREEFGYREDLRKECVFTIDPITARDLDDAVSCKELPNGNYEVGVHISDASFFLREGTRLDEQVRSRATTIYMVDSVYHMLPTELCLHCSLLPGLDKLSFSVFWEMTSGGEIVDKRFARTVINSCAQLAYEHAQSMIDKPESFDRADLPKIHNGFEPEDLSRVVNNLQKIAVKLREKRQQNGSLKIDQVKIAFTLDPMTGLPTDFWVYENKPAHRLIEEFMLLANMTVAEFIYEAFPDLAFLRLHEAPKPPMMVDLQKNLETIGIHIDIASSGGIQSSLNKYISNDFPGQCRMAVLNHLLAKPMKRAKYFCAGAIEDKDFRHFALSIPIYTHFTSPIRRYADIVTHRLLAASLNYCDKPKWVPEEVAAIAETCNTLKYNAKKAGDASSDLYLAHYVEQNAPFCQDAVVVDAKENSIDVIVLKTGSVVRIYKNNCEEGVSWDSEEIKLSQDESNNSENNRKLWKVVVKFPKTKVESEMCIVLEIFTLVRVELMRKPKSNKLEAKLLRPRLHLNLT